MQNFNLERTRAPRRVVPWWVYAGAVLVAGLLVWAVVKSLPSRSEAASETPAVDAAAASGEGGVAASPPAPATPAPTPAATTPARPAASPAAVSTPSPLPASAPVLREAAAAREQGDFRRARDIALQIWKAADHEGLRREAEAILNEVNIGLVLTPRDMDQKVEYTVVSGDSLEKIAKKFGTTIDLIRASNNIKGSLIRVGDRLRILQGQFSLVVSKSANDLVVYLDGDFFKRYLVGTGEYNKTPVGDFVINDRIAQPTWWRPDGKAIPYGDPENLLGTHWLSINVKGYGIHGTWEPDTIGKQASAGCVRLLNEDVEELYTLLPLGTPVSIRD